MTEQKKKISFITGNAIFTLGRILSVVFALIALVSFFVVVWSQVLGISKDLEGALIGTGFLSMILCFASSMCWMEL